jgi:hypothetical protein
MHSTERTFVVTDNQLKEQLDQGSHWEAGHWIWNDPTMQVLTEDGPRSPQQVLYYLGTHRWVDQLYNNCGVDNCIRGTHHSETKTHADEVRAVEDLILVQRSATTLASLYRKGKARGLLKPVSNYGG